MNRLQFIKTCGVAVAAVAAAPVTALAKEGEGEKKERAHELKLSECPEKVRKTIKGFAGGGKIGEVKKERKGNKWVYEAEFERNGQKLEILVAENGKLIKIAPADDDDEDDAEKQKEEKKENGERQKKEKRPDKEEDDDDQAKKKGKKEDDDDDGDEK